MTDIFSRTSSNRTQIVTAGDLPELQTKPAVGQYAVTFNDDESIQSIMVRNQKGYKNMVLSVDEFEQSGKRVRFDAVDGNGNVTSSQFIGVKALKAFIEAAELLADYEV